MIKMVVNWNDPIERMLFCQGENLGASGSKIDVLPYSRAFIDGYERGRMIFRDRTEFEESIRVVVPVRDFGINIKKDGD